MSADWNRKPRYGVRENGGGRPRLAAHMRRTERIEVLFTPAERAMLERHTDSIGTRMRVLILADMREKEGEI